MHLRRGQSVFLTQMAHVQLVLGREPLQTLLVLIPLLLFFLLQGRIAVRVGQCFFMDFFIC